LSSTKLAQKVGVSEATIVRFSIKIGCSGFPALQEILQNCIKERIYPSEKLMKYTKLKRKRDVYNEIFNSTIQNLKETLENIHPEIMDSVIDKIISAKRIYIVGLRRSFSVAYELNYSLSRLSMNTVLTESNYGLLFDKCIKMKNSDVCICISFPRYSTLTYEIMKYAKKKGCTTIAITDSLVSPIAQIAEYVLSAKCNVTSYFDSIVMALTITNCIVAGIARRRKKSIKYLVDFEKSLQDWNTWVISE